jgi:hypothetical protein
MNGAPSAYTITLTAITPLADNDILYVEFPETT